MLGYILRRIVLAIPVIIGVTVIVFAMVRFLPGDPARVIAGVAATEEEVETIRRQLGLDRPVWEQYISFMWNLIRLDLGKSMFTGKPVLPQLMETLQNTFILAVAAMAIAIPIGIVIGIISAINRGKAIDQAAIVASLFGVSMPAFWLGLMLILLFAVTLRVLPAGGIGTPNWDPRYVILPALTLAAHLIGVLARMTRSSMLSVLGQDYIRTARSKGATDYAVNYKHALRNALLPVTTITGLYFGYLLSGTVLTETVFA
ncbi:MAG: ABC transporter permease, partial [Nitrososphaerales archaeon]